MGKVLARDAVWSSKTHGRMRPAVRSRNQEGSQRTTGVNYDRSRDLPSLIALWPWEIEDVTTDGQRDLVARLRRALRLERQRATTRHWAYDLARHARLVAAYRSEVASLKRMPGSADRQIRCETQPRVG